MTPHPRPLPATRDARGGRGVNLAELALANHNPICRLARSFMISSVPPPIALTLTSR